MAIDISKMTLPEIFKHISDLPATKRSNALNQIANLRKEVKVLMWYIFRKDVTFDLPEGSPPYKEMEIPKNMGLNRLPSEIRKLEYLLPASNLSKIKKEKIFIEILESVSPEEAKLVLQVKEKKLPYKGITRKLAEEALPEIFLGESNS
jgi:hypothetical protein